MMPDSTDAVAPALCAGCGEVVPAIGRKLVFLNSGDVVHDSDFCVKLRNDKLDARRAQKEAGPELYEALKKHQLFFDKIVERCFGGDASESGSDLDYGEFLEFAEAAGLLKTEGYDPDKHGYGADSAPGDTWYVPTHIGRAALSKASGGSNG